MTLSEFLLARIAEDEVEAEANDDPRFYPEGWAPEHVQRVLADCEAKRRIVELHAMVHDGCPGSPTLVSDEGEQDGSYGGPCAVLRLLAMPYADHPDALDEWRP